MLVIDGVTDPESMEAVACREGLDLAADLALNKVRLASDCINVVRNIKGAGKGWYGQIVQEINARAKDLESFEVVHEGRSFNSDAHNLARSSVYFGVGRQVWLLSHSILQAV